MSKRKPLTWRGKTLMFLLTPVVVFGLLELGLRIGGFRYEPQTALREGHTHDELSQTEIYTPHPDLLWTLRPSSVIDAPGIGFPGIKTNAHGLRGEELPPPGTKAPGELRILCLGDSISFCLGLPAGETWPDRMAEALRASPALEGRTIRVVNAAVPGYSSVQGMRQFERLRDLEFDVVIFYFGLANSHRMRVLPDSALRLPTEGMPLVLAGLWKLRVFQLMQRVMTSVRETAAEGTRVSRAEFREHVRTLVDLDRAGGPRAIFVREPECCDLTIAQMERLVARAEEEGVDTVVGPRVLLQWIVPAPEGADLTGTRITRKGRPALRFRPEPGRPGYEHVNASLTLDELRADLDLLRELKRTLDAMLEGLPEGSLDYEALFGDARPRQVFSDNCHLTREGASLAGRALAEEVLRRLR